jgi:hypothetical protein
MKNWWKQIWDWTIIRGVMAIWVILRSYESCTRCNSRTDGRIWPGVSSIDQVLALDVHLRIGFWLWSTRTSLRALECLFFIYKMLHVSELVERPEIEKTWSCDLFTHPKWCKMFNFINFKTHEFKTKSKFARKAEISEIATPFANPLVLNKNHT